MSDSMTHLPFRVSARTARLIGRENVANSEAAVIELIKNGYDADSHSVQIIFSGDDLYIIDDGHGMDLASIQNGWMVIGTDNKQLKPTTPAGRIRSGAKGIGRFALDKLGDRTVMYTLQTGTQAALKWEVSWKDFEKDGETVDSVNASIIAVAPDKFSKLYYKLTKLRASSGTILHIQGLREEWGKKSIDRLFYSLRSLVPPASDREFSIELQSERFPKEYGEVQPLVASDYDYELSAVYDSKKREIRFELKRNELDVELLNKKYNSVYQEKGMGRYPFDAKTFSEGSYVGIKALEEILPGIDKNEDALQSIGGFSFQLTFAKNTKPNDEDFEKIPL